jgi:hypothetical protein
MSRTITVLLALGCVLLTSFCARPVAKTVPDGPPLDTPAPQHHVDPVDPEVPAPMSLPPGEPTLQPPAGQQSGKRQPTPAAAKPESKPEPLIDPAAKQPEDLLKPLPTLQTTPADKEVEVEQSIRQLIGRATAGLDRIDRRALSKAAQNQYDTAKRFVERSEEAFRAKNLVFAQSLAEKAAALAAQLARK